mmetsp:Transcript_70898/g.189176  ORF Transcript_70898/g.189176 Transcript_70898/m.189176 type:complete len:210 (+) Transcript_70898:489-1118(+)
MSATRTFGRSWASWSGSRRGRPRRRSSTWWIRCWTIRCLQCATTQRKLPTQSFLRWWRGSTTTCTGASTRRTQLRALSARRSWGRCWSTWERSMTLGMLWISCGRRRLSWAPRSLGRTSFTSCAAGAAPSSPSTSAPAASPAPSSSSSTPSSRSSPGARPSSRSASSCASSSPWSASPRTRKTTASCCGWRWSRTRTRPGTWTGGSSST